MTEEKICPFMSRPVILTTRDLLKTTIPAEQFSKENVTRTPLRSVPCQREKCMAWKPDDRDRLGGLKIGYCRLIERGG